MKKSMLSNLWPHSRAILKNGLTAWLYVMKLTIPALILTRLLLWFDLIPHVAAVFRPVMGLVGLPAEMALAWVAAMFASFYVAIAIYLSFIPIMEPLTVSQISTFASMALLCHSLLVEGSVCKASGLSFWRVTAFRLLSAVAFGLIIKQTTLLTGWGTEPAAMVGLLEMNGDPTPPWLDWALISLKQTGLILILIEALMLMMELVKYLGLTRLMAKVLGPPLRLAGVGERALMVTVIGNVIGLGYGGGLIVAESRSGRLSPRDIFGAVMLMSVFHSIVEDALLMWALGASLLWIVGLRLIFALLVCGVITRLARRPGWRTVLVGRQLDLSQG
ncbi:MAG: hypothetical protein LBP33_00910 [Candidatus Adiutrix sp.]|jgi:hypothetical protein|nr:hypothetical protein [Candidatus Adiutrix sp.]